MADAERWARRASSGSPPTCTRKSAPTSARGAGFRRSWWGRRSWSGRGGGRSWSASRAPRGLTIGRTVDDGSAPASPNRPQSVCRRGAHAVWHRVHRVHGRQSVSGAEPREHGLLGVHRPLRSGRDRAPSGCRRSLQGRPRSRAPRQSLGVRRHRPSVAIPPQFGDAGPFSADPHLAPGASHSGVTRRPDAPPPFVVDGARVTGGCGAHRPLTPTTHPPPSPAPPPARTPATTPHSAPRAP